MDYAGNDDISYMLKDPTQSGLSAYLQTILEYFRKDIRTKIWKKDIGSPTNQKTSTSLNIHENSVSSGLFYWCLCTVRC